MGRHASDNPHTRAIAGFVSGLSYDAIPGEVRDRIKLLVLEGIGCGLIVSVNVAVPSPFALLAVRFTV